MALMMVSQGLSREDVESPDRDISFPDSVIGMMKGELGHPPGGWPKALQKKVLKGGKPLGERPGLSAEAVDLAQAKHEAEEKVRTLPTRTFFYGMEPGEEISAEIDPGKTLEIRLQAIGETHEDGQARVFFELNGQPRVIRIDDRKAGNIAEARPKAEAGNPLHLGAPMPGVVATVSVSEGTKVSVGDLIVTIEAMKMETGLHAERAGTVKAVHVSAGAQVDAKDLLVEFE